MKPLHELLKGKVVNCQTQEEAREFMEIADKLGYAWASGESLIKKTRWLRYGKYTCYIPSIAKDMYLGALEDIHSGYITFSQFKQLLNENNMETKEVKIQVPEGYEIDKENSTSYCIKFKTIKKVLSYEGVAKELFKDKKGYYTDKRGIIPSSEFFDNQYLDKNNCTSEKQVQKLLAINKLMNVARYLNGDWKPTWENPSERKYYIEYYGRCNKYSIGSLTSVGNVGQVYFKSEEAAKQAIEILGEEIIKLAFSTDW